MRIIIEEASQAGLETPIHQPIPAARAEAMDGGAPSETLISAIGEARSTSAERTGMDGGSPPEWLVEAIQGAAQSRIEGSSADIDAGKAPSSE
jgi:hypothetical protein